MAKTVVIVHDDPEVREEYCKILWYNGFDVEIADSPAHARAATQATAVDLVLLGLAGRRTAGLDLCRALATARAGRAVPVLVVASRAQLDIARAARLAGCAAFVEEPAQAVEVLFAVERLIGRAETDELEPREREPLMDSRARGVVGAPLQAVVERAEPEPLLRVEVQGRGARGEGVDPPASTEPPRVPDETSPEGPSAG